MRAPIALLFAIAIAIAAVAGGANAVQAATVPAAASGGSWLRTGSLHTARALPMAVLLPSGKVLAAGGIDGSNQALASAEIFDPQTGKWTPTGSMNAVRSNGTLTLLQSGKVLAAGGFTFPQQPSGTSAELYDPATGKWTPTGPLPTFRANHTATVLRNGMVLVAGGSTADQSGAVASAELYDPSSGKWAATNSMSTARAYHAASLLASGQVLVSGGDHDYLSGAQGSTEIYNPANGTWSPAGRMMTSRREHTSTTLADGSVLVSGGRYGNDAGSNATAMADRFDATSTTWSPVADLQVAPRALAAVAGLDSQSATLLPDGRVLIAGGEGNLNYTQFTVFRSAELFDPQSNAWSFTASMHVGRVQHAAVLLADGRVLVIGGAARKALVTASCEIFTPSGDVRGVHSFARVGMRVHASRIFVAQSGAGRSLAAAVPVAQASSFGTASRRKTMGRWMQTGSMNVTRAGADGFPAVLLRNGKVLVEGCDQQLGQGGVTAELFDPATNKWALTGSMHVPRCNHGATMLPDGRVLVAGGDSEGTVHAAAEIYNPASGKWTMAAELNSTRFLFSVLALPNGTLFAPGGAAFGTIPRDSADVYDPAHNTWTATPSLNVSRYENGSAVLPDGKVLVFGGFTQNLTWATMSELYDPASNAWKPRGATTDQPFIGVTLPTGDVLATIPSQLYNEARGVWGLTKTDMQIPRINDTLTVLADGRALAAGGCTGCGSGGGSVLQSELYDPTSDTWSIDASLHEARSSHAAVRLKDGRVLIAGGLVGFTQLSTAEIYTPTR
jgi:Kelch motif protein/galactose oxidase-like protein